MERTLENEAIRLKTTDKAGEMLSLYDKKRNEEVLYQADQGWSGRNPTLFPVVGSTWKDGRYTIDGKEYAMKNHGLIRYAVLKDESTDSEIRYTLDADDNTRSQYPFDFHYEMSYRLEDHKVIVSYSITNTGKENMPFSFGLHPAFRTARHPGEAFEDFSIELRPHSAAEQLIFTADLDPVQKEKVMLDTWQLSREDLNQYATLVYKDSQIQDAILKYKDEPRVHMHFEGYPYLALWSHPSASDFVCIEPWFGHADFEKTEVPFDQREGTQILKPGETFTASYEIEPK